MEDRWFGKAFQIFEATDENDLEAAMVVLRGGTHIERREEERPRSFQSFIILFEKNTFTRANVCVSPTQPYTFLVGCVALCYVMMVSPRNRS